MKLKTTNINTLLIACILPTTLFLTACQDDNDKTPVENPTQKKEKADKVIAFREELDFINRFVETNVSGGGAEEGRQSFTGRLSARIKESAPCTDITEEELPDESIKITLNFGEGCLTDEGIEVAGSVVMIFRFTDTTLAYNLTFNDYTEISTGPHQGELVDGTVNGSFTLDIQAGQYTQTMEQDLVITYASNHKASYRSIQVAEMTEAGLRVSAFTTAGTLASGETFSTTLYKDVIYDFSCAGNLPTQGEETLIFLGNTMVINYGNGVCDKTYTVQ